MKKSENHKDIVKFKRDYINFNPRFREKLKNWEFGNLNEDDIDQIYLCQKKDENILRVKCFWKKRPNEERPRKPRYYPFYVIQNVAREHYHTAYYI